MSAREQGEPIGRPSDEQMRAYLDGEYGPPSPEAVAIVQEILERNIRSGGGHRG